MIHNMRLDENGHTTYMMVMIHNLTWCQLYFLVTIFLEIPKLITGWPLSDQNQQPP
jgi:hypothetical protein